MMIIDSKMYALIFAGIIGTALFCEDLTKNMERNREKTKIMQVEYGMKREVKIKRERELSRLVEEGTATLRIMKRSILYKPNFHELADIFGPNDVTTRLYDLDLDGVPDTAIDCRTGLPQIVTGKRRSVTGDQRTPTPQEIEWYRGE